MANVLSDEKQQQVLALGSLGWPLRRIEEATGVRRETASAYLKAAGIAVRPRRGRRLPAKPASDPSTDSARRIVGSPGAGPPPAPAKPASDPSTDSAPALGLPPWPERATVSPRVSACEPFRERIAGWVASGRNAMAIWQDLVTYHGFDAGYSSVKRFVGKLRGERPAEAHPVIETAPGQEGQVDYGDGPMVRHPETGKYRRTRLFVFTLGFSRKCVRLLVWKSSTRVWAELHERAFRRLGGATRVVVLDNLKEGVLKPDVYDPTLNPLYRDVLAHYGAVALPCRTGHPDRKGKVESGIGHTQKRLRGMRFEALEEGQEYVDRWDQDWADTRIHGTVKRQVRAMYEEERPQLVPLPIEPFRYYAFGTRTVHLDGAVEIDGAYYHAPPGWLGHLVSVQWDGRFVRVLDPITGKLLRELPAENPGRHACHPDDRPKTTPASTEELLQRAAKAGRHIGLLCESIHATDGELVGPRRIVGVLALVKRRGREVVEDACRFALEAGVPTYRFLKNDLERRPAVQLELRHVDPLIRELTHYRDLIQQRTEGGQTE